MPPAIAYDDPAWPERDVFVSVVAFDCLCIPVSDLRRAIEFYSGLFAMRVVAGAAEAGRAVLSREGRVRLALYVHAADSAMPFTRVSAAVESLEATREVVWDVGLRTLRDLVDADGAGLGQDEDSFAIADPDGHEIRFLQRSRHD